MSDQELLLKVAHYYYIEGLTQSQIAKRISLSRPTIVRMLQQAREDGLVEIRLTKDLPQTTLLESKIEKTFINKGLNEVIVVGAANDSPKEAVAKAASQYLKRVIRPQHLLGVGWSTTLSYVPAHFSPGQYNPKGIVQLVGSAGKIPGANAYEIAIKLGSTFDVPVEHMPTPAIVESKQIRDALMRDATIRHTMDFAPKCDIGLVGIGEVSDSSTMIQTGYLKSQDLEFVAAKEGVGDILGHYYDINGQEIDTPWQDRIMGMSLKQLCQIDNVIGVATGKEKSLAVWGALHGGYINTLIVDMSLAETISARLDQEESSFVG